MYILLSPLNPCEDSIEALVVEEACSYIMSHDADNVEIMFATAETTERLNLLKEKFGFEGIIVPFTKPPQVAALFQPKE